MNSASVQVEHLLSTCLPSEESTCLQELLLFSSLASWSAAAGKSLEGEREAELEAQPYRGPLKHTEGNYGRGIPRRDKQGNRWLAVEQVLPVKSKISLLETVFPTPVLPTPTGGLLALHKQSLPEP